MLRQKNVGGVVYHCETSTLYEGEKVITIAESVTLNIEVLNSLKQQVPEKQKQMQTSTLDVKSHDFARAICGRWFERTGSESTWKVSTPLEPKVSFHYIHQKLAKRACITTIERLWITNGLVGAMMASLAIKHPKQYWNHSTVVCEEKPVEARPVWQ